VAELDEITGWIAGRVPADWFDGPPQVSADREEILVVGTLKPAKVEGNEDAQKAAAAGRVKQHREDTREKRMQISNEAERRFERPISWGVKVGDKTYLFTHLSIPVMTRLRQKERQVLDSLVDAGVARSRSEAVAWCIRLVEQHESDWLKELREAMSKVAQVRSGGPLN
jgi:Arc/MetJ-type ribon-helix-helix transcriptional regulator